MTLDKYKMSWFWEIYGFRALHFENQKPQMNADERRFIVTGNTDDADLMDFHGYEICAYPMGASLWMR